MKNVDEVSETIDTTAKSPVYQFDFEPEDWLGDLTYDEQGRIVRARAAKMLYVIQATSSDEYNNRIVVCLMKKYTVLSVLYMYMYMY